MQATILRRYVAGHRRLSEFIAEEAARLQIASNDPTLHRVRAIQDTVLEGLTAAAAAQPTSRSAPTPPVHPPRQHRNPG